MNETSPTCGRCGGELLVVLRRAWCLKPYVDGGCGGSWAQRGGRWADETDHAWAALARRLGW